MVEITSFSLTIVTYLWTLALVMVGFYFVGLGLRVILNKVFEDKKDNTDTEEEINEDDAGTDDVKDDVDEAQDA